MIPFEKIPTAIGQLCEDMAFIKKFIEEFRNTPPPEPDRWFDLDELVAYDPHKRSKSTFYRYTREHTIPFHKGDQNRKLIFLKSEIDRWLKQGRHKTLAEISAEADTYLEKRGLK